MKERIVNNYGTEIKNICRGCAEGVKAKCNQTQKDHLQCAIQMSELEEFKIEQVPETFEELKELCKSLKVIKVEEDYIEIFGALIGSNMLFCQDGAIFLNTDCCFKEKATPQQMWQVIKNLIGEE